ncbi:MAG: nuclear transport factor 2 family protein [Acidobacteriota bacterium]
MSADNTDRDALRAAFEAFGEALNRGDYEAVVSMIAEDAAFWPDAAPATRGREPIRAAYERLAGYTLRASFDIEEIVVSGDLGLVRGFEHFRLEPRAGGEAITIEGRRAFSVWQRNRDGLWKNTHGMTNWAASQTRT